MPEASLYRGRQTAIARSGQLQNDDKRYCDGYSKKNREIVPPSDFNQGSHIGDTRSFP
jgi:hypothetical protein